MDATRTIATPRYRVIYAGLYMVLMVVGLGAFWDHVRDHIGMWNWIEPVSYLSVAAAGVSFLLAEVTEGLSCLGKRY